MKKRIFIAMHYMEIGGAEISLVGLLQALDYSRYDVDLFVYSHQGELMEYIPQEVNVLPEIKEYSMIERPIKEALKAGCLKVVLARLIARWANARFIRNKRGEGKDNGSIFGYVGKYVAQVLPQINPDVEYDAAISFLAPHDIVLHKVKAHKKICWIHTDYSHVAINADLEYPVWNGYNHIVSISESASKSFIDIFPSLREKVTVIENILSPEFVRQRAEEVDVTQELESYLRK